MRIEDVTEIIAKAEDALRNAQSWESAQEFADYLVQAIEILYEYVRSMGPLILQNNDLPDTDYSKFFHAMTMLDAIPYFRQKIQTDMEDVYDVYIESCLSLGETQDHHDEWINRNRAE